MLIIRRADIVSSDFKGVKARKLQLQRIFITQAYAIHTSRACSTLVSSSLVLPALLLHTRMRITVLDALSHTLRTYQPANYALAQTATKNVIVPYKYTCTTLRIFMYVCMTPLFVQSSCQHSCRLLLRSVPFACVINIKILVRTK